LSEKRERRAMQKNSFEATPGWGQGTLKTENRKQKYEILYFFAKKTFLVRFVVVVVAVVVLGNTDVRKITLIFFLRAAYKKEIVERNDFVAKKSPID